MKEISYMNLNFLKIYRQVFRSKVRPSKMIHSAGLSISFPHNAHLLNIPLFDANCIKESYTQSIAMTDFYNI